MHEEHKSNPTTGEDKDRDEGRGQSLPENDLGGLADSFKLVLLEQNHCNMQRLDDTMLVTVHFASGLESVMTPSARCTVSRCIIIKLAGSIQ